MKVAAKQSQHHMNVGMLAYFWVNIIWNKMKFSIFQFASISESIGFAFPYMEEKKKKMDED